MSLLWIMIAVLGDRSDARILSLSEKGSYFVVVVIGFLYD